MSKASVSTKYASFRQGLNPLLEKASAWVREHRRLLSWGTTFVAMVCLSWLLSTHGGWTALGEAKLVHGGHFVLAMTLWPLNMGLEAWKWRRLTSEALGQDVQRPWAVVWKEVLVGQTWALLGPFRLADGAADFPPPTIQGCKVWPGPRPLPWGRRVKDGPHGSSPSLRWHSWDWGCMLVRWGC